MSAADKAIEEIRKVRHSISAEFNHDIVKYLAFLGEEEKQHREQIQRGRELLAKRHAERPNNPEQTQDHLVLRDKPKS